MPATPAPRPVGRPVGSTIANPASAVIVIRTTGRRKSAYVRAAQRQGKSLAKWMQEACDPAAGHKD